MVSPRRRNAGADAAGVTVAESLAPGLERRETAESAAGQRPQFVMVLVDLGTVLAVLDEPLIGTKALLDGGVSHPPPSSSLRSTSAIEPLGNGLFAAR